MSKNRNWMVLPLIAICLGGTCLQIEEVKAASNEPGSKGAKIYCFMRSNGNEHEVSWKASYELIKRQASSLFKTSPRHAAVMITEAVVKEPNSFANCGKYLGDLFQPIERAAIDKSNLKNSRIKNTSYSNTTEEIRSEDRYSY